MKKLDGSKVGLALGGGAVLGAAHIGVLRALEEADIEISCVSGTSIGSLVGAMVARGSGPDEIEDAVSDLAWFDVSGLTLNQFGVLSNEKLGAFLSRVSDAVMASTAIPGVFAPVEINGRMLVDGGVVENVPVSPLRDLGADFVISVDLSARNPSETPGSIVEVIVNAFTILMDSSAELQTKESDLNIRPDLAGI